MVTVLQFSPIVLQKNLPFSLPLQSVISKFGTCLTKNKYKYVFSN